MSKRKLEDDIICNYTEEDRSFKPKIEILSVADADSSLMAPKSSIPAKMLPRHLQNRKANPNKKLTNEPRKEKKDKKLPDLSSQFTSVRPDTPLTVPSYPPPGFYGAPNPMIQPMPNQGFYPTFPGAYGQPAMPYYGEVPLQPPQAKQDKKSLPKVQVKKNIKNCGWRGVGRSYAC